MKKIISFSMVCLMAGLFLSACDKKDTKENNNTEQTESPKKALLTQMIGKHKLSNISAFMGANTMAEYTLANGTWSAEGSSVSAGEREPYTIELSDADKQKLNSMEIVVSQSLEVSLVCDGKTYVTVPFKENGMEWKLKKAAKEYSNALPEALTENNFQIAGITYLFAQDQYEDGKLAVIDIAGVMADALSIGINENTKKFEVNMFFGDCCDASTYTF